MKIDTRQLPYEEVLKLGFEGLLQKVISCEEKNGSSPFYSGVKRVCEAARFMGEKYAAEAGV